MDTQGDAFSHWTARMSLVYQTSKNLVARGFLTPGNKPNGQLRPNTRYNPFLLHGLQQINKDLMSAYDLTTANTSWGGDYLSFNGTTSHSNFGVLDLTHTTRIAVCMQLTQNIHSGTRMHLEVSANFNSGPGGSFFFYNDGANYWVGYKGDSGLVRRTFPVSEVSIGECLSVVVYYDATTSPYILVWIDGRSISLVNQDFGSLIYPSNFANDTLYFGARAGSSLFSNADFKYIALLDENVSAGQCQQISADPYNTLFKSIWPDYLTVGIPAATGGLAGPLAGYGGLAGMGGLAGRSGGLAGR